jgi:signal transduction histidine kinase
VVSLQLKWLHQFQFAGYYAAVAQGYYRAAGLEVELREFLTEIVNLYQPAAASKGLALRLVLAEELPPRVLTDPTRLRQILTNLLSNAVKFTAAGGVELNVSRKAAPGEKPAAGLVFEVWDTGVGIAAEARPRLFQEYSQADATISRRHGGPGLGLSIAKQLSDLLEEDLRFSSEPGRGSTFTLEIPLRPGAS